MHQLILDRFGDLRWFNRSFAPLAPRIGWVKREGDASDG